MCMFTFGDFLSLFFFFLLGAGGVCGLLFFFFLFFFWGGGGRGHVCSKAKAKTGNSFRGGVYSNLNVLGHILYRYLKEGVWSKVVSRL